MRETENNATQASAESVQYATENAGESIQSEAETNLTCLAQAAGKLCEVVVSACKNRSQFKENAEKGKRAKTDIKSLKEMCAVLKELTAIVKNLDDEEETGGEQSNVLEVIFTEDSEKYAL